MKLSRFRFLFWQSYSQGRRQIVAWDPTTQIANFYWDGID